MRAAGAAIEATDLVIGGQVGTAFCSVRPPGHHAEREAAMGFCFFNNVAVGIRHALDVHGLTRVALIDFDVHHGNGTQAYFEADGGLFYASSHQSPCYPGTGQEWERGAANNVVNAPLAPGSGSAAFRNAWAGVIIPALDRFAPELLMVISPEPLSLATRPAARVCAFAWNAAFNVVMSAASVPVAVKHRC